MPKLKKRSASSALASVDDVLSSTKVKTPAVRSRVRRRFVSGLGLVRGRAVLSEISQLTGHTIQISRGALPLVNLLAHDRDIHRDELAQASDELFNALYELSLIHI